MEWYYVILVFFGLLISMLVTGLPVAFSFLVVNLCCLYLFCGGINSWFALIPSASNILMNEAMLAVPLFILMGELLLHSGVAWKMCDAIDVWVGKIPGRLSLLAIIMGTIFAAMSGSGIAAAAMLGAVFIPEMRRRGYSKDLCTGPILGGSYLAPIIPPTFLGVILASVAGVSVGKLLVAAAIPGVLLGILSLGYIVLVARFKPGSAPVYQVDGITWRKRLQSLPHILPMVGIMFCVVGVIFVGIATPTEASALGAFATAIVVVIYRKLNKTVIEKTIRATVLINSMVFFIIIGSQAFSQILAFSGVTRGMVEFATNMQVSPIVVLLLMQIIIFIMSCFVDQTSIIMICTPMFVPIVLHYGYDLIWFCVVCLLNLSLGGITPPFGLYLYGLKGVAPAEFSMENIFRSAIPYIVLGAAFIGVMLLFPSSLAWLK
jgi:tripartite ATP-independent transporter DctM subunit